MSGMSILLLTTTGRNSGQPRTVALQHITDGESFVVIASHAGEPTHPAWLLNLRANPGATIQIGRRTMPVRAREAEGEERARLWRRVVEKDGAYAVYEQRTRRRIPVVVLERVSSGESP
jgi:deazaflavin-dependent oxidoreductase (nitroreductase family)